MGRTDLYGVVRMSLGHVEKVAATVGKTRALIRHNRGSRKLALGDASMRI